MAHTSHVSLSAEDLRSAALKILNKRFAGYGFKDVVVFEEQDFDSAEVIRMTATVTKEVPARELVAVTAEIMTTLRKEGDDRFVYLSSRQPGEDDLEEIEEE